MTNRFLEGTGPEPDGSAHAGRRRFLKYLGGLAGLSTVAMIITPVVAYLLPGKSSGGGDTGRTDAGKVADLPVGKGKVVAVGSKPAIVINTAGGVKAYSAICTHLGCIVAYDETASQIVCPCHDGRFSPANGAVVSGPPPGPLSTIQTVVEKDEIFLVTA
jgi:cytochrome b6-f complex iron-sulfur subunit